MASIWCDDESWEDCARARRTKIAGFQGCINKDVCGFYGSYLCHYSHEKLCTECEFKQFPDRFVACRVCRMPMHNHIHARSSMCIACRQPFDAFLEARFGILKPWDCQWSFERGRCRAGDTAHRDFGCNTIPEFIRYEVQNTVWDWSSRRKTPYFYRGAYRSSDTVLTHVWVGAMPTDADDRKQLFSVDAAAAHVTAMCAKYALFGPETGTLLTELPVNTVAVFPQVVSNPL